MKLGLKFLLLQRTDEFQIDIKLKVKVKWSRYRPGVAQRVCIGIALLFHDRDTRRGWVVSSTPRPHFTAGKEPVPIYRGLGGAQGRSGQEFSSPQGFDPRPSSQSVPTELPGPQMYNKLENIHEREVPQGRQVMKY